MEIDIEIEAHLVVEALRMKHGYDFRNYAQASLRRRLESCAQSMGLTNISELIPLILYDDQKLPTIINNISVAVTELFRDPDVFKYLREDILPKLESFPKINIWVAGCATGEEAFTLAIILEELGLLARTQIYATDINSDALKQAEEGIISVENIGEIQKRYKKTGGKADSRQYFSHGYGLAKIQQKFLDRIFFSNHNLTTDGAFGEFQLVLCRNVMIYFNQQLKDTLIDLISTSMDRYGFVCFGPKDNPSREKLIKYYDEQSRKLGIYKIKPGIR